MTAGPLSYPVPQRLLISGLMNYVYEGPYHAVRDAERAEGFGRGDEAAGRGDDGLSGLHPRSLRARAGQAGHHIVGRRRGDFCRGPGAVRRVAAGAAQAAGVDRAFRGRGRAVPAGGAVSGRRGGGRCLFLPVDAGGGRLRRAADGRARWRPADDRDQGRVGQAVGGRGRAGGGRAWVRGARGAGRGRGGECRRRRLGEHGGMGVPGRGAGRAAAQHHAVRVPDPEPEGAEPGEVGRVRCAGAGRGVGLCGGRDRGVRGAGRIAAGACARAARRWAGRSS